MRRTGWSNLAALVAGWLALTAAPAATRVNVDFAQPLAWSLVGPWTVRGGELQAVTRAGSERLLVPGTRGLTDTVASVTVRQCAGKVRELRAGLLFRALDTENAYFVLVRGDGAYWLGKLVGGKTIPALTGFVDSVTSEAPITLQVTAEGDRQTITINGSRLVWQSDGTYREGAVGLWVEGTGGAGFARLRVGDTAPEQPSTTGAVVAPSAPEPATPTVAVEPPHSSPPAAPEAPSAAVTPTPVTPTRPEPANPPTRPEPTRPEPAGPKSPPTGGRVLFAESFNPPQHEWKADPNRSIVDGEIRLRSVGGYLLSGFPLPFTDYAYRARCRSLSEGGGTYGLVARLQRDGSTGYLFVIKDPDTFAVARLESGKTRLLHRGPVALTPGPKELEVDCLRNLFTFKINGAVVATFSDPGPSQGGIGLWVDGHRQAAFGDLLVTELSPEARVTPPTGNPEPEAPRSRVLLEEHFDPPQLDWAQDAQRQVKDHALQLTSQPGRYVISGAPEARTGDYELTVDAARADGPDRGLVGVLVRLQPDSRSGYLFAFYGGSRYVVMRLGGSPVELARGEAPVRSGLNTLSARCEGPHLEFTLNGTKLTTVEDDTFPEGGFGLYCDNGAVASFRNLLAVALKSLP